MLRETENRRLASVALFASAVLGCTIFAVRKCVTMLIARSRFAWRVNAQRELGLPVGHALAAKSERDSRVRHCSIPA